ncbi:MAG: tetratricopeptide repeat protein, partial [Elusimicrobia bacterium]|nr:tetratricopeptide repeat protein [Elusimicrobiota bacterium]
NIKLSTSTTIFKVEPAIKSDKQLLTAEHRRTKQLQREIAKKAKQRITDQKISIETVYNQAVEDYVKKYYLRATDELKTVISEDLSYRNASFYLSDIKKTMKKIAKEEKNSDMEELSYAKAYVSYYSGSLQKSINEWGKIFCLNAENDEIKEYLDKTKMLLKEMETEDKLSGYYSNGIEKSKNKEYAAAINEWEKVIELAKKENMLSSLDWNIKAQHQITIALEQIKKNRDAYQKTINSSKNHQKDTKKAEKAKLDVDSAEKYYNEGLVCYAQGKISEAIRLWELTIRLNPEHERAKKAKETAGTEISQAGKK